MKNKTKNFWLRIKPRIFIRISSLLLLVFIAVIAAFNLFIHSYIQSDVDTQLANLLSIYGDDSLSIEEKEDAHIFGQHKSKLGADGDVLILDSSYGMIKYEGVSDLSDTQVSQIIEELKAESINLQSVSKLSIKTPSGDYYVSSMDDNKSDDAYLIFFVDVTVLNRVVDTVNLALVIIMSVALCISFVIANSIANSVTSPIRKLSTFAERIGKGDFSPQEFSLVEIELSELAAVMNQSAEKLSQYDSEQRAFFQNVSHELRTPLMAIKCHAEGIECGFMETGRSSRIIISETDRLADMVEELLYISRMDNFAQDTPMEDNDLRETLELCAENMKPVAEKAGIHLDLDFDDAPVMFCYNEKQIHRAVINLLSNAIRYAKSTVKLGCKTCNGSVEITVRDDGHGVAPEDLPHIFDRFYKGKDGKHGIGLSITKLIVALHKGTIEVSGESGSLFTVTFPISK